MMPCWKYSALGRSGDEISGKARGKKEAIVKELIDQGFYVMDIKFDCASFLDNFRSHSRLSTIDCVQFFEDFYNMYAAGMSIAQILESLKATAARRNMIDLIAALQQRMGAGEGFTEAITHTGIFPWIVPVTVRAGEQTGKLHEAFKVLEQYFRRSRDIHSKLTDALIYPVIAFIFLMTVMLLIGLYVVPKLHDLLPADASGNIAAQAVFVLSALMRDYYALIFALPIVFLVGMGLYRKNNKEQLRN